MTVYLPGGRARGLGRGGVHPPRFGRAAARSTCVVLAAALLAAACGGGGGAPATAPDVPRLDLPAEDARFLRPPLEGWPEVVPAELAERLEAGHEALLVGDRDAARAAAAGVAGELPEPAAVLAAEVDLSERRAAEAADRLRPVVVERPGYLAAGLVLGRALETLGEIPEAYGVYRALGVERGAVGGEGDLLAAERAGALEERAVEIVSNRIASALETGETGAAARELERLEAWRPDAEPTLLAAAAVARAEEDREAELVAVRRLVDLLPPGEAPLERLADLEVEVGDVGAGLEIFEELAAASPEDPRLAEKLAAAQFRFRMNLLPDAVRETAARAELERGDVAVLLYWLLPPVRYGRPSGEAVIATDILEDPRREEISRVVNLGVMPVDPAVHHFAPERPATRATLLRGVLRFLGDRTEAACAEGPPPRGEDALCAAAAGCDLLPGECFPGEPLSGSYAVEVLRRALDRLGPR